jgi:hypothetical protein
VESPETHEEDARIPVGDALSNLRIDALPDDWTPTEAFLLIKSLDEDGDVTWSYRTTQDFSQEELLGALQVQVDRLRDTLLDDWLHADEHENDAVNEESAP